MSALRLAVAGGVAGVVLAAATVAVAGTGAGGVFNLGADNTVNKTTTLRSTSSFTGPQLQLKNVAGGSALALLVNSGKPPLTVNSAARVANLNADRVDGVDSSALIGGAGEVLVGSVDVADNGVQVINYFGHPSFDISFGCRTSLDDLLYFNNEEKTASTDLFADQGGSNPTYAYLASLSSPSQSYYRTSVDPNGDWTTFRAYWSNGQTATVWVTSIYKPGPGGVGLSCHVQAQAVTTR